MATSRQVNSLITPQLNDLTGNPFLWTRRPTGEKPFA